MFIVFTYGLVLWHRNTILILGLVNPKYILHTLAIIFYNQAHTEYINIYPHEVHPTTR